MLALTSVGEAAHLQAAGAHARDDVAHVGAGTVDDRLVPRLTLARRGTINGFGARARERIDQALILRQTVDDGFTAGPGVSQIGRIDAAVFDREIFRRHLY